MSVLAELQERVQKTNALIAQCESKIATAGIAPPLSVLASVRSLEKLKRKLEAEFMEVAQSQELEVYRYRILGDAERMTLAGIAEAWMKFQEFFACVYSALQKAPKTTKKPNQPERLELGYGYSFAGSVGVVVTVQRDVGIYAIPPLEEASSVAFDLVEGKNVRTTAEHLGPKPIQALHEWVNSHVRNKSGIGLEWHSQNAIKRSIEIQYPSLLKLESTIADTTTQTAIEVNGELVMVDTEKKDFKLKGDDGVEYSGQFENAITAEHAATIPARYQAKIVKTTKLIILGKEPKTTLFLDSLRSL